MANLKWLRIPAELRERKQWLVSSLAPLSDGKVDKAPRNPRTKAICDAQDPANWGTFEEVINSGMAGIGFVLSSADPYTIIDLDDKGDLPPEVAARHLKIYEAFPSYAERSQSGRGVHIIIRGVMGGGMNRDSVEVYDQERYIVFTGDVCRDSSIIDHQDLLTQMVEEMGGINPVDAELPASSPEHYSDAEILERASTAKNGEKFRDLYYRPPTPDEDWSHRDSQLAQMIAFYTRNHEQALRLFRGSALYRPHGKGKNPVHYETYYLLGKTFGRAWRAEIARDADISHGKALAAQLLKPAAPKAKTPVGSSVTFPPGLVGEVADFIYKASPRPVKEISLASALALCAGLCGRQYNVGGTGLNIYVVLLAETGRGKEAGPSGIEALVTAVRQTIPSIEMFMGPAAFGSGQGLVRALDKNPALFSALGEFGHLLQTITDRRAGSHEVKMRQMLLALYSKSGKHQVLRPTAYSDTEKNTATVTAPAFTFLGDTTPEVYYSAVNSGAVAEGLLPRFLTITYDGPRVEQCDNWSNSPSPQLVEHLSSLVQTITTMQQNNTFIDISFSQDALALDKEFSRACDDRINEPGASSTAEIWNRAHLKMRRVAGILAVGRNHLAPIIGVEDIRWAQALIEADIESVSRRVASGDVGVGDSRRIPAIQEAVKEYLRMSPEKRKTTYKVPNGLLTEELIPYTFFRRRLQHQVAFSSDIRGTAAAIKTALQDAVDMGILQKLTEEQRLVKMGRKTEGDIYAVGEAF